MSNRNHRIKRVTRRREKYTLDDLTNNQPHCNDRWRALRKLSCLNAQYVICGVGQYSFWSNVFYADEKHPDGKNLDSLMLKKREEYLHRKGITWL